ncbi:unnamed protein product [Amoebophrya sp. A120]|nr:unnamed protein product [Amoebophrya sp. A120]|eukprot:GSA120T00002792001.1
MSLKSGTLPQTKAFEKKPKNHGLKYSYVSGVTDTGNSVSKAAKQDSDRLVVRRRDELFKRVRMQTLSQHIRDHYQAAESVYALGTPLGATPTTGSSYPPGQSVVVDAETPVKSDTLLILDVRDPEEYDKCHVLHSKSYPKQLLSHDKISAELYAFKARPEKRLVVYDTDDKATARIATTLVEKGFTNVYGLSGGFEEACKGFPEVMKGDIPNYNPNADLQSRPGSSCSRLSTVSRFTQMSTRR